MQTPFSYSNGFHFIEILLILTIISVLTMTALPTYYHSIAHTRRLDAANKLTKLALALETYYMEFHTYEKSTLDNLHISKMTAQNAYQLDIDTATANDYRLTATPQGNQSTQDKQCGVLVLNAAGEKSNSGPGSLAECW